MRLVVLGIVAFGLSSCASHPDIYDKPGGTQAMFHRDFAGCKLYAMNIHQQHTPRQPVYGQNYTTTYTGTANTYAYGNAATTYGSGVATTTAQPNPGAQFANGMSALGDAIVNAARHRQAVHLCMQAKGYTLRKQ